MHKMKEPKYVAETLKWCNEMRKEEGKNMLPNLPKGKRSDPTSCPCGKATGLAVGLTQYYQKTEMRPFGVQETEKPLPIPVVNFVKAFDAGKLPQYEL